MCGTSLIGTILLDKGLLCWRLVWSGLFWSGVGGGCECSGQSVYCTVVLRLLAPLWCLVKIRTSITAYSFILHSVRPPQVRFWAPSIASARSSFFVLWKCLVYSFQGRQGASQLGTCTRRRIFTDGCLLFRLFQAKVEWVPSNLETTTPKQSCGTTGIKIDEDCRQRAVKTHLLEASLGKITSHGKQI